MARDEILPWGGHTSRLIKQESIRSTSGKKTGVRSSADPLDELGWAMGMLHETGAGRSSVRDAAYNKSKVARSGFTRGRTTYCNSQRGSPREDCPRGHARRRNACHACVFHQSFRGTNRGHRMEQIPPHRWGRPKGDVLAKMYVCYQAERERQEKLGTSSVPSANGGIRVDSR